MCIVNKRPSDIICVLLVKDPVIDITRFSSWKKLFRVTAYVYRFVFGIGKKPYLMEEEVKRAGKYWIKEA